MLLWEVVCALSLRRKEELTQGLRRCLCGRITSRVVSQCCSESSLGPGKWMDFVLAGTWGVIPASLVIVNLGMGDVWMGVVRTTTS